MSVEIVSRDNRFELQLTVTFRARLGTAWDSADGFPSETARQPSETTATSRPLPRTGRPDPCAYVKIC